MRQREEVSGRGVKVSGLGGDPGLANLRLRLQGEDMLLE